MIAKINQKKLRNDLFRHLDGIVTAPTAYALHTKGITEYIIKNKSCSIQHLSEKFNANEGYLNVGLRVLCSQGWLLQKIDNSTGNLTYHLTKESEIAFNHFYLYQSVVELLKYTAEFHPRKFAEKPFVKLEQIYNEYTKIFGLTISDDVIIKKIQLQILKHIEGIILGPSIVRLGMNGMFHKYFMEANFKPEEFHKNSDLFGRLLDIFVHFGWFNKNNGTYQFTEKGFFYAKRASAYGVTVSYIPTLRNLDELIFGNPTKAKMLNTSIDEGHVDREMNVWGSGGAHTKYFKVIDEVIIRIFNQPIQEQPKGILDMGCGNGAFIQHLYNVIEQQTLRGSMLDEYPLILVGADYNNAAIKITKANLIQADIWAKVVFGDIGKPDQLAEDLRDNYGVHLNELLNVRTFLDHNRIWENPKIITPNRNSLSSGAYSFEGQRLDNNLVEDSLLEHFIKWAPYVRKYGLLIIELHTINPQLVAKNLGMTAATAYDATHGYSDQFIVEVDVFNKVLKEAGLIPDPKVTRKFPNSDLATVSINLYRAEETTTH